MSRNVDEEAERSAIAAPRLVVWTARISSRDPDRFDVTRAGAWRWGQRSVDRRERDAPGHPFAPSIGLLGKAKRGEIAFAAYAPLYLAEMRKSYREHRAAWDALLARPRVVLACYEVDPRECHRSLLATILGNLGADVRGERSAIVNEPRRVGV
jgi:hypothetical protein